MYEIRETEKFSSWLQKLKDIRAKARIMIRIERLASENPGDVKAIGDGISELRIDYGPGYRIYFTKKKKVIIILLVGGNKKTQSADIKKAIELAQGL